MSPDFVALRTRFPGLAGGWARFDGPAGTQMVDVAIDATAAFSRTRSGGEEGFVFGRTDIPGGPKQNPDC